jgi:hypothetical protein
MSFRVTTPTIWFGNRVLDNTPKSSSLRPVATPYTAMLK